LVTAALAHRQPGLTRRQLAGLVLAPVACLVLWFLPTHESIVAQHALAIAALTIVLWITEAVDHATAGFIGLALFWATGVGNLTQIFSGFTGETPWFLLGALLIGSMAAKSGLAERVAFTVTAKTGSSYSRLLLGFIIVDFLLTFVVPSGIARVTILGAIAIGVVEAFKVGPRSHIGRGLFIIITYAATIFDKMLIAGAASILARGLIQDLGGVQVLYSLWFLAYLPCDIITIVACWRLILWLYPPEKTTIDDSGHLQKKLDALGPWKTAEKKCAAYLLIAVTLWMTDFIHHISPALIGIAVGLLGTMPRIGVLDVSDVRKLNFSAIWFTAAALSLGRLLSATKGLEVLTDVVSAVINPFVTGPLTNALVLYWTAFVYHFFLGNETAMLSTSMPVIMEFAKSKGFDPLATGMIWTFASGGKIFVYQGAVLIVGYSFGYFDARDLLKVGLALTVIESLILLLLVPLYWPLLGIG
jgi:solute carrier family 13 (sodium-dependent dicarboxylate transporter), member 2/3/5